MSNSKGELVLITGATGYLGYSVLVEALKAGYNVRLAIRSESKLQTVLNAPSVKAILKESGGSDRITWTTVPDMAVPGAYDEAVKGVKYIIHVASPIPSFGAPNPPSPEEYEAYFIQPALASDLGMLKSAAQEPTVKRVVLTSSAVANVPFEYFKGEGAPSDRVFTAKDRIPAAPGPWDGEFEAYSAGKAGALNEAERFVREQKPGFDLIPVIPGWIFGRNELITNPAELKQGSTNSVLLSFLLGGKNDIPLNGNWVLGTDAAKTHVLALDPAVKGNQAFVASFDVIWEDALKVLKSKYPEAVRAGKLNVEGEQGTINVSMPPTETERTLGFKFQSLDTIVSEVVDQWLELSA